MSPSVIRHVRAALAMLVLALAMAPSALASDINDPAVIARVKAVAKAATDKSTVSFADGLYDSADGDVYIDGNPDAVWRLKGNRLVAAPTGPAPTGPRPLESCGFVKYFHCESTNSSISACNPQVKFYRDYFTGSDTYGTVEDYLNPPEQISVRDEPYRRYGPSSVRAYNAHTGLYGFYRAPCTSGGF